MEQVKSEVTKLIREAGKLYMESATYHMAYVVSYILKKKNISERYWELTCQLEEEGAVQEPQDHSSIQPPPSARHAVLRPPDERPRFGGWPLGRLWKCEADEEEEGWMEEARRGVTWAVVVSGKKAGRRMEWTTHSRSRSPSPRSFLLPLCCA